MDRLTSKSLRQHADSTETIAWGGQARMLLNWAADALDAAEQVAADNQQQAERIRELEADRDSWSEQASQRVQDWCDLKEQLAEVMEYASRLRGEVENLQKVKGRHNSEIACGRLFDTLAIPLPKAMQS